MTVPLTRQQIAAEFRHPDSACRWMCQVNGPHRLEVPQPRQLSFRHQGTRLGNVSIGTIEYAPRVTVGIADLNRSYQLTLPHYLARNHDHFHPHSRNKVHLAYVKFPQEISCFKPSDDTPSMTLQRNKVTRDRKF
ncbi:hypothetical protein [Halomonas sp. H5]|uniref:AraC-like ligand-binding domain-containing protein n=1 Tax=Halomonas sp. H5 TaxID=3423910 RepID=UPI003D35C87A